MNKVVVVFEAEGMTSKEYEAILESLKQSGRLKKDNRPAHIAFQKGKSWCVIDVWDSEEALMDAVKNDLVPVFQKLGINPPQPQIFPVHNFIGVDVEETISA